MLYQQTWHDNIGYFHFKEWMKGMKIMQFIFKPAHVNTHRIEARQFRLVSTRLKQTCHPPPPPETHPHTQIVITQS